MHAFRIRAAARERREHGTHRGHDFRRLPRADEPRDAAHMGLFFQIGWLDPGAPRNNSYGFQIDNLTQGCTVHPADIVRHPLLVARTALGRVRRGMATVPETPTVKPVGGRVSFE